MRRFGRRAILVLGTYVGLLLAVVIAGFLDQAVGISAAVLWGAVVIVGVMLFRPRRRPSTEARTGRRDSQSQSGYQDPEG